MQARKRANRCKASLRKELEQRRARDSNPQPVARHLNSNQGAPCENADEFDDFGIGAAPGAAVRSETDPELAEVVEAWGGLLPAIKAAILGLARG